MTTKNYTIEQMKHLNASIGHHWFSPSTMRYFSSRILYSSNRQNYFITSERMNYESARRYTIRYFDAKTYQVDTIGEFGEYATSYQAKRALETLLSSK